MPWAFCFGQHRLETPFRSSASSTNSSSEQMSSHGHAPSTTLSVPQLLLAQPSPAFVATPGCTTTEFATKVCGDKLATGASVVQQLALNWRHRHRPPRQRRPSRNGSSSGSLIGGSGLGGSLGPGGTGTCGGSGRGLGSGMGGQPAMLDAPVGNGFVIVVDARL